MLRSSTAYDRSGACKATFLKYRNWLRDGRSSATGMLDRSVLVGKPSRESGGVRYAGFRVLRGGEEPRQHGARIVVEKQPTAAAAPAAAPAHTVPPLRRSLTALGQSSLRRSSALTVFRMAMRRSDLFDTTPKFLIDPARIFTAGYILEEAYESVGNNTGVRDIDPSFPIVDRRSRNLTLGKLIASDVRDVEKIGRDTSSGHAANSTTSLLLFVNARTKKFTNGKNITLFDNGKPPREWRIKGKYISKEKCKYRGDNVSEAASILTNLKFPRGVVEPAQNILESRHLVEGKSKDTVFIENTEYTVLVDVPATVYASDFISAGVHVATTAHAPRTCHASHAGGPTRTYGPPIAPQLDDRVSVTLDFRASAGLGLPGTIPTLRFIRFRRSSLFLATRVRICLSNNQYVDRREFPRKSTRVRCKLTTLPASFQPWNVRVV